MCYAYVLYNVFSNFIVILVVAFSMRINIFQKKRNNVYRSSLSLHVIVIPSEKLLVGAFPSGQERHY